MPGARSENAKSLELLKRNLHEIFSQDGLKASQLDVIESRDEALGPVSLAGRPSGSRSR
jgi:hypothetical protein